jgi:hypothetical protein
MSIRSDAKLPGKFYSASCLQDRLASDESSSMSLDLPLRWSVARNRRQIELPCGALVRNWMRALDLHDGQTINLGTERVDGSSTDNRTVHATVNVVVTGQHTIPFRSVSCQAVPYRTWLARMYVAGPLVSEMPATTISKWNPALQSSSSGP